MRPLPWIIAGLLSPYLLAAPARPGAACVCLLLGALLLTLSARLDRSWKRSGWLKGARSWSVAAKWRASTRRLAGRCSLYAACFLLGGGWALANIEAAWDTRYRGPHQELIIEGRVVSLPVRRQDLLTFQFEIERSHAPYGGQATDGGAEASTQSALRDQARLELRWFRPPFVPASLADGSHVPPRVGERWRFRVRAGPPRASLNFTGRDSERYWFGAGIDGLATVIRNEGARMEVAGGRAVGRVRERLRSNLVSHLGGLPGHGLVQALTLGDRSGLAAETIGAMRATGTGHLLAISGLHVGMVAVMGATLFRVLFGVLSAVRANGATRPARQQAAMAGLLCATAYAGLAGFGTSPRRALFMVAVVTAGFLLRRRVSPWRSLGLALAGVLTLEPLAPLQAGFWLSFGAVSILLLLFLGQDRPFGPVHGLVRAQLGLSVVMAPMGLAWFGFVSLSALTVNLVAIPFVSLLLLPLSLLALVCIALEPLLGLPSGFMALPVDMAERAASLLVSMLHRLHVHWPVHGWNGPSPTKSTTLLALLGGLLCLVPGALKLRALAVLLLVPLVLPRPGLGPGALQLDVLDVGQGQAILVQTARHRLLIDTGPGSPGRWSLVNRTLVPALSESGPGPPDLLLISHGDSDHAGGLADLLDRWPGLSVLGSFSEPQRSQYAGSHFASCHEGRSWQWDGFTFAVLHPTRWLPYRGNDSSCVLEIRGVGGALLLPGDIGKVVERRLSRRLRGPFRFLVAPHHGSDSSSSAELLDAARPEFTAFTLAYGNRFGFPDASVLGRYAHRVLPVADTASCGALRLALNSAGQLSVRSARHERTGFWRTPPPVHCPDGGPPEPLTSPNAFRYHAGHPAKNLATRE